MSGEVCAKLLVGTVGPRAGADQCRGLPLVAAVRGVAEHEHLVARVDAGLNADARAGDRDRIARVIDRAAQGLRCD